MSARFEIVHRGPHNFHARFIGGNGEIVWTTENYTRRRACREAIADLDIAVRLHDAALPPKGLTFREVDERGAR